MSAANWAVCPRCRQLYPMSSDDELRTFREDYEIGINSEDYGTRFEVGQVSVIYKGHCSRCKLGLDFEEHRPVPGFTR